MATGIGFKTIMGCAKQADFRTAVTSSDRLLLMSEGISWDYGTVMHEYLHGGAGSLKTQRTSEPVGGSVEIAVPYTEMSGVQFVSASLPIALAFGATAWDAVNSVNQITLSNELSSFGTYAWDKGMDATYPWELTGGMISSLSLSCAAGDSLKASIDMSGYNLAIDNSTTTTLAELAALPSDVPNLCIFTDMTFRINYQEGALDSGDDIGISEFTLSVNNNMSDFEQTSPDDGSSHTDTMKTIQPIRNGTREVTFEFAMPRYESDYFFSRLSSDSNLQASIKFENPTDARYMEILLPNFKVESVEASVGGAGAVTQSISCRCFKTNADSDLAFTDTATSEGEVWIETSDERTASIL